MAGVSMPCLAERSSFGLNELLGFILGVNTPGLSPESARNSCQSNSPDSCMRA